MAKQKAFFWQGSFCLHFKYSLLYFCFFARNQNTRMGVIGDLFNLRKGQKKDGGVKWWWRVRDGFLRLFLYILYI